MGKSDDDLFGNAFGIDLSDLDFVMDDFNFDFDGADFDDPPESRILKPPADISILTQTCCFDNALDFAEEIDLTGKARTFAWISGGFIYGDIIEALWRIRHVDIRNLYVASLSLSYENIDSWAGLMQYADPPIEHFDLLLSAYFYSHNKFDVVPEIYAKLDDGRFQVAYGAYHTKIICIETHHGNTIVIHGSANTRSSSNIEQIMVEVNQPELFDFNRDLIHDICTRYGTINMKAPIMTRKQTFDWFKNLKRRDKRWHPVAVAAADVAADAADPAAAGN